MFSIKKVLKEMTQKVSIILLFSLVLRVLSVKLNLPSDNFSSTIQLLTQISEKISNKFDVRSFDLVSSKDSENGFLMGIFMKAQKDNYSFMIKTFQFNILEATFIEASKNLIAFQKDLKQNLYPYDYGEDYGDNANEFLNELLKGYSYWLKSKGEELVLVPDKEEESEFALYYFQNCKQKFAVELNSFDSEKWEDPLVIPDRTNYAGCSAVHFSSFFISLLLLSLQVTENDAWTSEMEKKYQTALKYENEIRKIFQQVGNFKKDDEVGWDLAGEFWNCNFCQYPISLLKIIQNVEVMQTSQKTELNCFPTYYEDPFATFYSPPDSYDNYEKMLLPFDVPTWICFCLVFVFSFLGIIVINKQKKSVKDIFFGEGVKWPSFNVIGAFFGIGQTKVPESNFGRIMLMNFIIFCLLIRTAYQGLK